jgi:hypothetical protein
LFFGNTDTYIIFWYSLSTTVCPKFEKVGHQFSEFAKSLKNWMVQIKILNSLDLPNKKAPCYGRKAICTIQGWAGLWTGAEEKLIAAPLVKW